MEADFTRALAARLLAMGDDELVLGHRNSEWCGHAPILEEDIAFANISLDELGHAIIWYGLLARITEQDPEKVPDQLTYSRRAEEFRNVQMVELPRGDWAFTMLRQYLFDTYESIMLEKLAASQHDALAAAAAKIRKEEIYHRRHTCAWIRRLGLGTDESHQRVQTALDALWPYALTLFTPLEGDELLAGGWHVPRLPEVQAHWEESTRRWLTDSGLVVPGDVPTAGSRTEHTKHLSQLLDDLQEVTRQYPNVEW